MKIIRFKENGVGRYEDVSPFPIGDLELQLDGIPNYNGDFRFVASCNGVRCAESTLAAGQNLVTLPREVLTAGRFSVRITHYIDGEAVRIFKAEDLLITALEVDFTADPEISQMQREIDALTAENVAVKERISALETALESANAQLEAFEKRISTLEENNDIFTA